MSERIISFCRACDALCGVRVDREDGRTVVSGDPDNPSSLGHWCEAGRASLALAANPARVRRPMKRIGTAWVETSWDEAIREIGAKLREIRSKHGARAIGVHAGGSLAASSRGLTRTAAFAVSLGTPNLFTSWAQTLSPWWLATERVIGHPAALQSDVGRAHYAVLLGGNQETGSWGPQQAGPVHGARLAAMRKVKKSRLVVADPRRTPSAEGADVYLPLRPGTDAHLLLGMLGAAFQGDWKDDQYVRDYTVGTEALRDAVGGWTAETASAACGVDRGALAGVALKFARAAMATVHPGRGTFASANGSAAAFALLALHGLTANLLRAGGLYETPGLVDLEPILRGAPSARAPRSRVGGRPLVLLQLPAGLIAEEARVEGDGRLRALFAVESDPLGAVAGAEGARSFDGLELFVVLGQSAGRSAKHAHWILPTPTSWERDDDVLHATAVVPFKWAQRTSPVLAPPPDARPVEDVLADIAAAAGRSWRGSAYGTALTLLGHGLVSADLEAWRRRAWDLLGSVDADAVDAAEGGLWQGEVDRTPFRPSHDDRRLHLDDPELLAALRAVTAPEVRDDRLFLGSRTRAPGEAFPSWGTADEAVVSVHPAAAARFGVEGARRVVVRGPGGEIEARLEIDPNLREDSAIVPGAWGPATDLGGAGASPLTLLLPDAVDPLTGSPAIAGTPVSLRRTS